MKKRIKICGSPAVPNIRAKPSEIADSGLEIKLPGSMIAVFLGCTCVASANKASGLKPNLYNTAPAINEAPINSSTALMICTQVVAFMPPKVT